MRVDRYRVAVPLCVCAGQSRYGYTPLRIMYRCATRFVERQRVSLREPLSLALYPRNRAKTPTHGKAGKPLHSTPENAAIPASQRQRAGTTPDRLRRENLSKQTHARRSKWVPNGYVCKMRFTYVAAAVAMAIAVMLIAPVVLMGASSAHADISGYRRCVGKITELPLREPDPQSLQLARRIEQDLNSGVSPAAETQKVAQTGFDPHAADAVVQCVMQNSP